MVGVIRWRERRTEAVSHDNLGLTRVLGGCTCIHDQANGIDRKRRVLDRLYDRYIKVLVNAKISSLA